jgi:hypothetical protein
MYIDFVSLTETHKMVKEQHGFKKYISYPSSGKKKPKKTFKMLA